MRNLPGYKSPFPISKALAKVIAAIKNAGGKPVAVGGCVRDHLLGLPPKDIDVEVYQITLDELHVALQSVGSVYAVGKSFGVLKVTVGDETKEVFDVSLPRRENKEGRGHKGFVVNTDEKMTFADAALRRDFTVNAIGYDLLSLTIDDPHHGAEDLKKGVLRHVSDAFDEDPLRVLRGAQFAARFDLTMAPETIAKCKNLKSELPTLASERIYEEMRKLLLAQKPSLGLQILWDSDAISLFTELVALYGCKQEKEWHPEGDVWVHTLMVVDAAAKIVRRENLSSEEALIIVVGALCHDLGKPLTTAIENGRIRSKGHEGAGARPTQTLLAKMGMSQTIIDAVVPLVQEHLKPFQFYKLRDTISDGAIRRLSTRVPIDRLCLVSEADFLGRTTEEALKGFDPSTAWLKKEAERLSVQKEAPSAILLGRHLLERGVVAGPKMGKILSAAFEAQLDGEFTDLDGALKWYEKNSK